MSIALSFTVLRSINSILLAFAAFFILFNFNIMPYLWVKTYYLKYLILQNKTPIENINFDKVFKKHKISKREREVCKLIIEGNSNKDIEEKLYISYNTVKNHVYNIFQKFGVSNRVQLINFFKSLK